VDPLILVSKAHKQTQKVHIPYQLEYQESP